VSLSFFVVRVMNRSSSVLVKTHLIQGGRLARQSTSLALLETTVEIICQAHRPTNSKPAILIS